MITQESPEHLPEPRHTKGALFIILFSLLVLTTGADSECCYHVEKIYTSHLQEVISNLCEDLGPNPDEDCQPRSTEMVRRLRMAGYQNLRVRCGFYKGETEKTRHCWVDAGPFIIETDSCEIVAAAEMWRYK